MVGLAKYIRMAMLVVPPTVSSGVITASAIETRTNLFSTWVQITYQLCWRVGSQWHLLSLVQFCVSPLSFFIPSLSTGVCCVGACHYEQQLKVKVFCEGILLLYLNHGPKDSNHEVFFSVPCGFQPIFGIISRFFYILALICQSVHIIVVS